MEDSNIPELLSARLLFTVKPSLDATSLAAALRQEFKQVDNSEDSLLYFFPDYPVTFKEGELPAQVMVAAAERPSGADYLAAALQQSWHWSEAATVVAMCDHEVIVTDFMTRTLAYTVRVELFQKALDAFVQLLNPQAIYFTTSDKVVEPVAYLERGRAVLDGLLKVRFFNIADSATQEMFLDTLGLHALGLPDFQIRFADLDPNQVVGALMSYSYYVFEKGPIIEDGNTIQGITPADKWICHYTDSLIGPERLVIQLETAP
ncbi:DUF4261 domain-containing protein [Hymenobacter volaticus]|uniref:DUF4261 domain-containing protein n=1 Tax=Hymenobacter volaticus TaxID=2932254 RepID=A0ABY4G0P6_9BACT|nr:DUF4261 domain-containing protein [Hymenobacter volaticus]UOQ64437.1 DUF4261 domain-containing protein [Hymenobacter volaticus]